MKYAIVAVELPINKLFQYSIPVEFESQVIPGRRVIVPFKQHRVAGCVVDLTDKSSFPGIKPVESLPGAFPCMNQEMLKLTRWISEYYFCPWGEVLKAALPACVRRIRKRAMPVISRGEGGIAERSMPFRLNTEQEEALGLLLKSVEKGKSGVFLLHGITASGKTEIYLQAIAYVLEREKQAIVLVPEISLTPQTSERFEERFGKKIALLHSHLTDSQRYRTWKRISSGEAEIVIGPRSAIFAPVKDLGLIIVDEEHENSYKQMESPRYHLREAAIMRGKLNKAPVLLGSATPSIESYYNAQRGQYGLIKLTGRIDDRALPDVDIIDMRDEKSHILSAYLKQELEKRLFRKERVILFLNRRGFSSFSLCRRCGYVVRCKKCSVSLTYHASSGSLVCHYCNYEEKPQKVCPQCGSGYLRRLGVGTQQVEKEVLRLFPKARVQRMDSDSTSVRGSHMRIFNAFKRGEIDILIGTQMIAKGLDIPEVTLVGVISADTALNFPDFRASERTFQLLTQVAGRAGRGDIPGKVIIQTFNPGHYAIAAAKNHDYEGFYKKELEFRRQLLYPPFSHLIILTVTGKKQETVESSADTVSKLADRLNQEKKIDVLGPVPAPLSRIRGKYRWQVILKGKKMSNLHKILISLYGELGEWRRLKGVKIIVDVDPVGML